ncbi:hypothetical protein GIB67_022395 [Kingdonia uniflora]|uniref:Uncharacterized protein n=1 Tax=Kingdonia uniflora TaxID=39325 RepID=A0A7J7MTT2_9MAGN|nr:hypothetical protein GIB67_022395 [Kingdonia uniflora]
MIKALKVDCKFRKATQIKGYRWELHNENEVKIYCDGSARDNPEAITKQIPGLLGPGLNKAGKFPTSVTHQESLEAKVNEAKVTVKT